MKTHPANNIDAMNPHNAVNWFIRKEIQLFPTSQWKKDLPRVL